MRAPSDAVKEADRRALDELFSATQHYRFSPGYKGLLDFVVRFRFYSPYNAMLVHIQLPGATYVAPPERWRREFGRAIRAGARPLVILQPKGPVMFVFDVSDTEPLDGAPPLPSGVTHPFEVAGRLLGRELDYTVKSAARDGVSVTTAMGGSHHAGAIRTAVPGRFLKVLLRSRPKPEYAPIPLRYEVVLNSDHSVETQYATLVHELAHLYCGHLGTPNTAWWPDRQGLSPEVAEFEAESVSYLVCRRQGIETPSAAYLDGYLENALEVPPISLESVSRAAGLIEQMGRSCLKPRKE